VIARGGDFSDLFRGYAMSVAELRKNAMMAHLVDALSRGEDIGHYGRLVFVMVARHFLSEDQLLKQLKSDPSLDEEKARALIEQVATKGYSPPSREKVLEFQKQQESPICPNPKDPDACNVYKDLKFPPEVYESITEYHEEKVQAES
jgi:DNA primase large subunit